MQHFQIDQIWLVRLELLIEYRCEVVFFCLVPEVVEELLNLAHDVGRVVAEVEFHIGGETGAGEVGRPCDHAVSVGADEKSFAVKELIAQFPHLNPARLQPSQQVSHMAGGFWGEAQHVSAPANVLVKFS